MRLGYVIHLVGYLVYGCCSSHTVYTRTLPVTTLPCHAHCNCTLPYRFCLYLHIWFTTLPGLHTWFCTFCLWLRLVAVCGLRLHAFTFLVRARLRGLLVGYGCRTPHRYRTFTIAVAWIVTCTTYAAAPVPLYLTRFTRCACTTPYGSCSYTVLHLTRHLTVRIRFTPCRFALPRVCRGCARTRLPATVTRRTGCLRLRTPHTHYAVTTLHGSSLV